MNYARALLSAITKQGIELTIKDVPFNIYMKHTMDILSLCFLEEETDNYIIVVETNINGEEELRIVPKDNIEYISICYGKLELQEEEKEDIMFI